MPNPKILSEQPISMAGVKDELSRIKERDSELSFRATKTDDYLAQFTKLSRSEANELYELLEKLNIPRLKDIHLTKIVDLLPSTEDEARLIVQAYPITVSGENIKKISKTVSDFLAEKGKN